MTDLYVKTKLFCNVSKLPIFMFDDKIDPLSYIAENITKGKDSEEIWRDFKKRFSYFNDISSYQQLYNLNNGKLKDVKVRSIFLPWIHSKPSDKYHDVWLSIFKDKKMFLKSCRKIASLIESIKKNGYNPALSTDRHRGITGYFLSSKDKAVFYVNAGNHRVAALKSLNIVRVECAFQDYENLKHRDIEKTYLENISSSYFIREYNTQHAGSWPSVKSGFIDEKTATLIAERYIHGY